MTKVDVFLTDFAPCQMGYDLKVTDETATINDYLQALDVFAAQYMANCKGCDGCCYERAPLTVLDITAFTAICPKSDYPAHQMIKYFGDLQALGDGAVDIILNRPQGLACNLLDQEGKCCTQHKARPFVCRSHFCLPKSEFAQKLRSLITNYGMDALIMQLYEEEQNGAEKILPKINPQDYQHSPLIGKKTYDEVIIKEICPDNFWEAIYKKQS